ncbi:hypothetical protein JOD63_002272 [Microbacterium terrae]|uniref:Uncharacterized protein n=1 Tax=Microbacterium terrae TaxID=69369 RepID=A0A0M2GZR3_9MICO|nr:hypothetical protein [Microbacterium terrae]KJL39408.1 hypothetical protein RS81_02038 [Microbacterium terrae]MBP1078304.1 hypothetical protein [Microbacterium terrae]GLJ97783.1 hypothetical protein GCM10017594_09800 [Microbacterium terrae]
MFKDIFASFGQQFPNWRIRTLLIALIILMAAVPVGELLVLQIFSTLLVDGPGELAGQVGKVLGLLAIFFVGFGITRGLHHMTKFWRVRLFRSAFADVQARTGIGSVGWQWAVAFDVSTLIADMVQVVAIAILLLFLDRIVGAVSAVLLVVVVLQMSMLYRRQMRVQRELMESTVRDVEAPIRERVFSAEFAAVATSVATGVALAAVVWQTFTGALAIATAIVLAMALRIFFSRVGGLAPTLMRYARDSLRLERDVSRLAARAQAGGPPLLDDDGDGDGDLEEIDAQAAAVEAEVAAKRRAAMIDRVLIEAQRGESAEFHHAAGKLLSTGDLTQRERDAMRGADAFLSYSTPGSDAARSAGPVAMFWVPKPLPGSFDEWVNPYLIHAGTRRAVQFVPLKASIDAPPHIVLGGSLLANVQATSIVAGAGIPKLDARVNPGADFVSLRGPLTARAVRREGGPAIETFGDPRLLVRRVHRIRIGRTNGRLVFVRNHSDADIPFVLPPDVDELSIEGSRPEQVLAAINALAGYDGVVTSSVGVMVICQSYGIPAALVAVTGSSRAKRVSMEFRDHLQGADLEHDWRLHETTVDLSAVEWRTRLVAERVASAKLDEIDTNVRIAIERYEEAIQDEVEQGMADDQDEDG